MFKAGGSATETHTYETCITPRANGLIEILSHEQICEKFSSTVTMSGENA